MAITLDTLSGLINKFIWPSITSIDFIIIFMFISFFTPNGQYPFLAAKLIKSLNKFDLPHDIVEMPPMESWTKACSFKSTFILDKLLTYRRPVIWLDIDTEVWRFPTLLFGDEDFGIYNWHADNNHHLDGTFDYNPQAKTLCCSGGVQKWGYTAPAIELLLRWICAIQEHGDDAGDDPMLDRAFNESCPPVKPLWLPKVYNRMDKHTQHWSNIAVGDVVINHDFTNGNHRKG